MPRAAVGREIPRGGGRGGAGAPAAGRRRLAPGGAGAESSKRLAVVSRPRYVQDTSPPPSSYARAPHVYLVDGLLCEREEAVREKGRDE